MISEWITSTTRYWIYVTQFDPDETLEDRSSNFYRNARFGHVREVMNSAGFCEATRVKNTETEKKRKVTYVRIPIILNVCFSIRMV